MVSNVSFLFKVKIQGRLTELTPTPEHYQASVNHVLMKQEIMLEWSSTQQCHFKEQFNTTQEFMVSNLNVSCAHNDIHNATYSVAIRFWKNVARVGFPGQKVFNNFCEEWYY